LALEFCRGSLKRNYSAKGEKYFSANSSKTKEELAMRAVLELDGVVAA
jgi:hypothetical protein